MLYNHIMQPSIAQAIMGKPLLYVSAHLKYAWYYFDCCFFLNETIMIKSYIRLIVFSRNNQNMERM